MTKIPLRVSRLQMRRRKPMYIIIHHTVEMYPQPIAKIDNSKYQLNGLFNGVLENKDPDINYHFVLDKIKDDYAPITCRPFVTLCEWDDIPENINNAAIHIGLLGSYDYKVPEKRLYDVLAYRLINPLLKTFALSPTRVKLHSEVTELDELSCPGDFFDKAVMMAKIKQYVMR